MKGCARVNVKLSWARFNFYISSWLSIYRTYFIYAHKVYVLTQVKFTRQCKSTQGELLILHSYLINVQLRRDGCVVVTAPLFDGPSTYTCIMNSELSEVSQILLITDRASIFNYWQKTNFIMWLTGPKL